MTDPFPPTSSVDVTSLLEQWGAGDSAVLEELIPLVYADLRRLADRSLRRERPDHTLQPTALVHEAYMRLARSTPPDLGDRKHFLCLAARLMRQILVDHARKQRSERRGGRLPRVPVEDVLVEAESKGISATVDLPALDDALEDLARLDERKAKVIDLRYFGGFEVKEVAQTLGISVPTVVTDTRVARAWLLANIEQHRDV